MPGAPSGRARGGSILRGQVAEMVPQRGRGETIRGGNSGGAVMGPVAQRGKGAKQRGGGAAQRGRGAIAQRGGAITCW